MRIELVVDVPGISNPDAVDAIRLGNEVVRLVRGDVGDLHAELIHVGVGSDISVPRDFDPSAPVVSVESTDIVHDPSAITPHAEDYHVASFTPYHVGDAPSPHDWEAAQEIAHDDAWDHAQALLALDAHKDAALAEAYPDAIPTPDPYNTVTDHGAPTEPATTPEV